MSSPHGEKQAASGPKRNLKTCLRREEVEVFNIGIGVPSAWRKVTLQALDIVQRDDDLGKLISLRRRTVWGFGWGSPRDIPAYALIYFPIYRLFLFAVRMLGVLQSAKLRKDVRGAGKTSIRAPLSLTS